MRTGLLGAASMLLVSACATLEPEPCTSDWVQWRTTQITDAFSSQYRSELSDMRRFATRLENPSPLLLLELSARLEEFSTIATDFSDTVVPELQSAVEQCGTSTNFVTAFSGFLEEQGMPETVLDWAEELALTVETLSEQS